MGSVLSTYGVLHRNFGFSAQTVRTLALFQLRWLWNQLTGGLDYVLYPRFKTLAIERPVFVLGNPRSGTTLMHRFLASAEPLCAFALWEMLFPAISARKLLRPLIERVAHKAVQSEEAKKIHETGLKYAETDDAFLLLQLLDGPLYWGAVQAWEPSFAGDFTSEPFQKRCEQRFYPALEAAWRRNLFLKQKSRLLVKSSAVSASMPHLLKRHPDARIVYMMRNPLEVIPRPCRCSSTTMCSRSVDCARRLRRSGSAISSIRTSCSASSIDAFTRITRPAGFRNGTSSSSLISA